LIAEALATAPSGEEFAEPARLGNKILIGRFHGFARHLHGLSKAFRCHEIFHAAAERSAVLFE
jgi:hypothetical protein